MEEFKFDPVDGWEDASGFPTNPADETATRTLFQKLYNQIRDFINTKIVAGHNAHLAENVNQKEVHGLKIESGLWEPKISIGNHTYKTRHGSYNKNGKQVILWFNLELSALDTGMTGFVSIGGFPFVADHSKIPQFHNASGLFSNISLPTGRTCVSLVVILNTAQVNANGSGVATQAIDVSHLTNMSRISGTIIYETA